MLRVGPVGTRKSFPLEAGKGGQGLFLLRFQKELGKLRNQGALV